MFRTIIILSFSSVASILAAQQISKPEATFNDQYLGDSLLDSLVVPNGFTIELAASKLESPNMIAIGRPDELYVTSTDQGEILLLKDYTGDGNFDETKSVAALRGVQGIAVHKGFLYACTNVELKRGKIKPDGTLEPMETLIADLPDNGPRGIRTVNVGPDGLLYIAIGTCPDCKSDSNHDDITILKVRPEGNAKVYAHGLRKTTSIAWHPETKEMWVVDQGFDVNKNASVDELTRLIETSNDRSLALANQKSLNNTGPEEAGAKPTEPLLILPPYSEPVNIIFLSEEARFPPAYLNDALISLHGAWDSENPHGYLINRIRVVSGMPVGTTDFMHGFLSKDGKTRYGRPTGLAVSPKGYLYVSDDFNGVIYKVSAGK